MGRTRLEEEFEGNLMSLWNQWMPTTMAVITVVGWFVVYKLHNRTSKAQLTVVFAQHQPHGPAIHTDWPFLRNYGGSEAKNIRIIYTYSNGEQKQQEAEALPPDKSSGLRMLDREGYECSVSYVSRHRRWCGALNEKPVERPLIASPEYRDIG